MLREAAWSEKQGDYTPHYAYRRLEDIFGQERAVQLAQRRFQILKYKLVSACKEEC
jgi:hypothetical protein